MSYINQHDVVQRLGSQQFINLTDIDGDGIADAAFLADNISDVEAEVDGYIGQRYSLPLSSSPAILKRICVDILVYRLSAYGALNTEEITKRYNDAVSWLKEVADGSFILGGAEDNNLSRTKAAVITTPSEREMTRCKLSGLF